MACLLVGMGGLRHGDIMENWAGGITVEGAMAKQRRYDSRGRSAGV